MVMCYWLTVPQEPGSRAGAPTCHGLTAPSRAAGTHNHIQLGAHPAIHTHTSASASSHICVTQTDTERQGSDAHFL